MKKSKQLNIKNTIYQHVTNNSKEYILITLIFLLGIFLGVMFINNAQEAQRGEVTSYLSNFLDKLKNTEELDNMKLLRTTIIANIGLAVTLWFFGTTVIRNTYRFWNNTVQGILPWILNIFNYINIRDWKRNNICANNIITTKYNIYSSYNCNWSKSDLNYINQ